MATPLPFLYSRWIDELLGHPLPNEERATCHVCAMCPGEGPAHPIAPEVSFSPEVKCCTYLPSLPNFRVGAILAGTSPQLAEGRSRVAERVRERRGATPLGVGPGRVERVRLVELRRRDEFGQRVDARCPYLVDPGGTCAIWAHREATCATYFCKYDRGVVGAHAWRAARELLEAVERELSLACLVDLDLGDEALAALCDHAGKPRRLERDELPGRVYEDGRLTPSLARRVWGRWHGQEEAFYMASADWAQALDWAAVRGHVGARAALLERRLRAAVAASTATPRLDALCLGRVESFDIGGGLVSLRSPEVYRDPVRVPESLFAALDAFDGRPTSAVLAEIAQAGPTALDAAQLEELTRRGVLMPMPDEWVPPGEARPVTEDDVLCFFHDHPDQVVATERLPGDAAIVIASGAREVTFDEPDLFPFAERLAALQRGFQAGEATGWGGGYEWSRIREIFEALLRERVLVRLRPDAGA